MLLASLDFNISHILAPEENVVEEERVVHAKPTCMERFTMTISDSKVKVKHRWEKIKMSLRRDPLVSFYTAIFVLAQLGCILGAIFEQHSKGEKNVGVYIARIGGMLLNVDVTLLFLSMARETITLLRDSPLGNTFPFDHTISTFKTTKV